MTKTIVINAGSSSLKWKLFEMPRETVLASGLIEKIGMDGSVSTVKFDGKKETRELEIADHVAAVEILLDDLKRLKIIADFAEITGVGHRIVAGGENFSQSVVVGEEELAEIDALSALAPLHNHAEAQGIRAFKKVLPEATAVAAFDTAFHATMPAKAYRYPLANELYEKFAVRKYGAHGTSHFYVSREAAKILGRPVEELKLVTAHIGNGASITAVDGGKSVDTSMGFTPLGGVMMGTRSGDLDPAIVPYLIRKDPAKFPDAAAVVDACNFESGVLGVFEKSSDMRDLEAAYESGDEKAVLAFEMYVDRVKKFIGQYFAVMNGADALVFTAGVGENSTLLREKVAAGLSWFGLKIDPSKNVHGATGVISSDDSKVKILVIPTDEELVIARDVEKLKK